MRMRGRDAQTDPQRAIRSGGRVTGPTGMAHAREGLGPPFRPASARVPARAVLSAAWLRHGGPRVLGGPRFISVERFFWVL